MIARASMLLIVLWGLATPAVARAASGQDQGSRTSIEMPAPGKTQELTLRDGSRLFGRVIVIEPELIVFRTVGGVDVSVLRTDIAALRIVAGRLIKGMFVPADPNATRLFFGPTARSLERGQGYVAMYEFVMPFVQVGLTDRVSVGAGTPLIFGGGGNHPFWVTPKVQVYDAPRTKVAVGLLHLFVAGDEQVGIAYGVATLGSADSAATVGAGYAYETADDAGTPVVMVGGERRVHRRLKLVTENYLWPGATGLLSGGVRFIGDRLSADLGLVMPLGADDLIAFPVVNFVWAF